VKMIQGMFALLLLSVLAGRAFVQTARPPKALVIETGDTLIPEDVVGGKGGDRWLGLYVTESGSSLIESTVMVKLSPKPPRPGDQKVISATVDNPNKPVFLVKSAAMLKPGPAQTIYQGGLAKEHDLVNAENLASRKSIKLKLGDQEYQLRVLVPKATPRKDLEPCSKCVDINLELAFGAQTQIVEAAQSVNPTDHTPFTWGLLWAGDLDGDGKLDLYMRFNWDNGVPISEHRLYLSSKSKPGQLVGEVGRFVAFTY
jgi:hypothetical protein